MNSKLFSINFRDVLKAALTAAASSLIAGLYTKLNAGALPDVSELKVMGIAAVTTFLGSIMRRFVTNSDGSVAAGEKK